MSQVEIIKAARSKGGSVMRDWMKSYGIILMIPLIIAVINQIYARNVLQNEVETVHTAIVENIGSSFDNTMYEISRTSQVLYASTECFALRNITTQSGLSYASYQMKELFNRHCRTNNRLSLMAYLPAYDHVVTNLASYSTEGTWRVLRETHSMDDLTYEQWIKPLARTSSRGRYFISNTMGTDNLGTESLCFALTLPMNSPENGVCHLFVCLNIDDILSMQGAISDGCLLAIVDGDGSLVRLWDNMGAVSDPPALPLEARSRESIRLSGVDYIALSAPSGVTSWTFALLVPTSVFTQTLRQMAVFSTLSLLAALILGIVLVALFLRRHYLPVNQILAAISTGEAPAGNEYDRILSACQSLTSENTSIKDSLRVQEAYIQEKFLLSRLLGRDVRPADSGIARRTAALFTGKAIRMVAFCLSLPEEEGSQLADHFDTMQYQVHRLFLEQLKSRYDPPRVIDNNCVVYLFPLTKAQNEAWPDEAATSANAVCDEFEAQFKLPLLCVLSNPCESLELCHELYTEVGSVVECLTEAGESGAISVSEVLKLNDHLKTSRHISGYKLREAIVRGDAATAETHLGELYGYIGEKAALSFDVTRFLYFSILRLVGKAFDEALPDDGEEHDNIQIRMGELMLCADQDEMERAIQKFVRDMCAYILRRKVPTADGVARAVCEYIEQNYADDNLNISHIACALNLCPQTVTKYCKQETGMSVLDYIARIRINQAKRLAEQGDLSLEELSEAVGYASVRTFHRAYMKLEGTTPGRGLGRVH